MDGIYYYWFSWIAWTTSTFLMKRGQLRLKFSVIILLLLILTAQIITINNITINLGLLILLIYGYLEVRHKSFIKLLYFFIITLTITLGYVSFHLFELIDPVWVFFNRKWMLAFGLAYFTIILQKNNKERITCLILSVCHGEILYKLVIQKYDFQTDIGSFAFFDILAISYFMVIAWNYLKNIVFYFDSTRGSKNFKKKRVNVAIRK